MHQKKPLIYVVIDQGMIWEAYSDVSVELIVKNVDRQWIRHLEPVINQAEIKEVLELLGPLEELQIKMPGLVEEESRRIKIRRHKAPLRRR